MRTVLSIGLAIFANSLFVPRVAPQSAITTPGPLRDESALNILRQSLNAAGGVSSVAPIQNLRAMGNITYFWAGTTTHGTAVVRARGPAQYRLDVTLPDGVRSIAVSRPRGQYKENGGTATDLPIRNFLGGGNPFLPFLSILEALNDPSTSVTYIGMVKEGGRELHQIRIQRKPDADSEDPDGTTSKFLWTDYFVEQDVSRLVKLTHLIHPVGSLATSVHEDFEMSDFEALKGSNVATRICSRIDGQKIWELKLQSVDLDSRNADEDFSLE